MGSGGTFATLPAPVASGLSPVTANASSTIARVRGAVAGSWGYWREPAPVGGIFTSSLTAASLFGGALGAGLLLVLPSSSFGSVAPTPRAVPIAQFLIARYGGYFGGAVGTMTVLYSCEADRHGRG